MPSRTSSDGTKYAALPPPRHQQKFPNRRRSIKRNAALPAMTKSQSTLTQLDFCTPRSTREVISISSDDDEEYEEAQSANKKRRRKSKFDEREPGQSSMTQFDRGDSPQCMKRPRLGAAVTDGFEIWEDYDPEQWEVDTQIKLGHRSTAQADPFDGAEDVENGECQLEIPETSQSRTASSPRVDSGVEARVFVKDMKFQTPRKIRFKTEVPSSQTPPSTKRSAQASQGGDIIERSPLKQRSSNLQTAVLSRSSPETQNITMQMLERVKFGARKVPLNDTTAATESPEKVPSSQDETQGKGAPSCNQELRQLQRITTIQDSQVDDVEAFSLPAVDSAEQQPPRKLERTTTIQNSQSEDLDLELLSESNVDGLLPDSVVPAGSQSYGFQSTYDPAYSALDRDAARFGWTQTQHRLHAIKEHEDDSETDNDDLDAGCMPKPTPRVIRCSTEPSREWREPSPTKYSEKELEEVREERTVHADLAKSRMNDDDAYESAGVVTRYEDIQVPSSPPLEHPSQVSTVVPTQFSHQQSGPIAQFSVIDSPVKMRIMERFVVPVSPHKVYSFMPEAFSSSPLPLPPWSSPEKAGFVHMRSPIQGTALRNDGSLESLVDFSLPPPPPMSSSKSGR